MKSGKFLRRCFQCLEQTYSGLILRIGSIQDSRHLCQEFFAWYNHEHHHSSLQLLASVRDLQCLAELDRAALLMRARDMLSYEDIAAALGMGAGAAKIRVHRARRRIAELRMHREESREKHHT